MRGSKRPKPGGKWELRVPRPPHPLTGARRELSRTVIASEREADVLLAKLVVEASREQTSATSTDLAMLHERWINHLRSRGRAPSTIRSYEARWRVVADYLGHRSLADLTAATLDHLYDELLRAGKGTATVSKVHVQLKTMLGQARKWSLIETNPAELATPPSHSPRPTPIPTLEQFHEFLRSVDEHSPDLALFLQLLFVTGARKSEMLALTWTDVSEDTVYIRRSVCEATEGGGLIIKSTKTGANGHIGIGLELGERLEALRSTRADAWEATGSDLDPDSFVFSDDPLGSVPWRPTTVSHRLLHLRTSGGHDNACTAQALRALCASELNAGGITDTDVRDRLLQTSVVTTRRHYIRPSPRAAEAATSLLTERLTDSGSRLTSQARAQSPGAVHT